jgi:hypothetical protein
LSGEQLRAAGSVDDSVAGRDEGRPSGAASRKRGRGAGEEEETGEEEADQPARWRLSRPVPPRAF